MPPSITENPEAFFEELNKPQKEEPAVEVSPVTSPAAPIVAEPLTGNLAPEKEAPKAEQASITDDPEAFFSGLTKPAQVKEETPQDLVLSQLAGKTGEQMDDFDMKSLNLLSPKELEEVTNQRRDIPLSENLLRTKFDYEMSLPWNEGINKLEDWKKIGQEVFGGGVSFLKGAQKFAEQSLFADAEQDPSGWGHPSFKPVKDYVSGIASLPESAAYLFTKLKEGGMGLADRLSESIGVQDREKSYENYKARNLVDRIQAQETQENPSIYSRILKGDMANDALAYVVLNTLPDRETLMAQEGLTAEQADSKRKDIANAIARQTTSDIASREKPADEDIATFATFTAPAGLALGEMGLVSLGLEAGMGLTPKIAQGIKYLGKTDQEIKAMNDAAQALQKEQALQGLEKAQKPSMLGRAAGALATGIENTEAAFAKIGEATPNILKELAPPAIGAVVAGDERRGEGAIVGALLGKAGKPALAALKYASKTPALIRDIEEARVLAAGGSKGTFETLASFPEVSENTAKILRFGGRRLDNTLNNVVEYAKAGVNPTLIALATGALDSASPEELNKLTSTGLLYGLGGRVVHQAWGKITGVDPVIDARNRRQQDIDDLKTYRDLDPETRKTLDSVTSWDNIVDLHTQRAANAEKAYNDAVARGKNDAEQLGKVAQAEKNILSSVTRANVQTRDEFSRQFVTQLTKLNQLVNGTLRAGQNNVGINILTPEQIVAKFRSDPANAAATDQEILDVASQRGFYSTPEGAVEYQAGMGMEAPKKKIVFDRTKPSVVINADALKARMMIEGSTPIDALNHEVGHHVRNIPEFREVNKDAEDLLFSQEVRDPAGNVVAVTAGQYSGKDLVDMYLNDYLKGKTPDQITQLSQLAGLWDYSRGALNESAVAEYMKDEIIAELNSETFSTHLGKGLDNSVLHMLDVARLKTKKNLLDRAVQKFFGLGGKGEATSDLTGARFSPDVLAANRQAMRALQSLQGEVSQAVTSVESPKISRSEMLKNKAIRERYGKYAGLFKTKMQGQVFDGNGNPIGSPIDITNPSASEGSWESRNGETKQLNGYGARPDEVAEAAGVVIPDGGRLVVQKQIVTQPDGVTPVMMTPKEAKDLQKNRAEVIRESLNTPDEGAPNRFEAVNDDSETWRGTFTPLQIQAIKDMPEGIIPKSIKEHMLKINDMIVKGDGGRMLVDYAAVMNDAGKYTAYSPKIYDVVPIGMHLSKGGNFLVTTISVGRMFDKLNAWSERMPARLAPWGGSKDAFFKEFTEKYLQNWQNGLAGETGLSGDKAEALAKKDIFNDFLNLTTNDFRGTNIDRTTTPRRRGDVRGKNIDRTIMSMRLDHMAELMDNENAPKVPIDYGKAIKNFMPAEETAPAQEERRPTPFDGITAAYNPQGRAFGMSYAAPQATAPDAPKTGISFMPASAEIREKGSKQQLEFFDRVLENSGIKDKPNTIAALDKFISQYVGDKYSEIYTNRPESQALFPQIDPEKIKNYYQKAVRNATPEQAADFPPDWLRIRNMDQAQFDASFGQDRVDQITQFRVNALAKSADYLLGEMKAPEQTELQKKITEINDALADGDIGLWEEKQAELEKLNGDTYENLRNQAYQGSYSPAEVAAILNASAKFRVNTRVNEDGEMTPVIQSITNGNEAVPNEVSGETASKIAEYMRMGMSSKDAYVKGLYDNMAARAKKRGVYTGWKKYDQSDDMGDAETLNADCAGTGWCTGGSVGTANSHLSGGDFYLYFENGDPQVAIRTDNGTIAEVRGRGPSQNITSPKYDAEAEKFIVGADGPTGGTQYLNDRNFRKLAVEVMKTGVLPDEAYKYYNQNGNFISPKPQMSYSSEFEKEYTDVFRNAALDVILDSSGNLKTSLSYDEQDQDNLKYKTIAGDITGPSSMQYSKYDLNLPNLESVKGGIITNSAENLYLPKLKSVDFIFSRNAIDVDIKSLEKCNAIQLDQATSLIAPKLEEVSRVLNADEATQVDLRSLKKAGSIRLNQLMDKAKAVDLRNLEESESIDINIGYGGSLNLPKLRKADSFLAKTIGNAGGGEVYVPLLEAPKRTLIATSTLNSKGDVFIAKAENPPVPENFTWIDSDTGKTYKTKSMADFISLNLAIQGKSYQTDGGMVSPKEIFAMHEVDTQYSRDRAQGIQFMPKSEARKEERTERLPASGAELTASLVASGTSLESFGKDTLIQLAESYGIEIPKGAKRGEIIDAINERPISKEPVKPVLEKDNRKNVGISFMPKNEDEFSYRGEHQGPDENNGAPMHEVTRGIYPDDLYSLPFDTALQYYGDADESGYSRESLSAIRSVKGNPKAKIKIYRAVPKYVGEIDPVKTKEVEDRISRYEKLTRLNPTSDYFRQELDNALAERPQTIDSINAGDWVTPSRTYAKEHGEAALRGEYKILSKSVPASHLFTEGNSLSEFGYNPPDQKSDIRFMPAAGEEKPVPTQEELDAMKARLPKYTAKTEKYSGKYGDVIKIYSPDRDREVGFAIIGESTDRDNTIDVYETNVDVRYRGKGYGEALYREIAKFAQGKDASTLFGGSVTPEAQKVRSKLFETQASTMSGFGVESKVPSDIRFMPSEKEKKTLTAVHNLSEENLRNVLKVGGLAVPSVAVIRNDRSDFTSFGEITLVAPYSMVDPKKDSKSKVFNADVYSPRYPKVDYSMPDSKANRNLIDSLKESLNKIPEDIRKRFFVSLDTEDADKPMRERFLENPIFMAGFLADTNRIGDVKFDTSEDKRYADQSARWNIREFMRENSDLKEEFNAWIDNKLNDSGVTEEEKLFAGYTPSGKRRYLPHTLDNVVKMMAKSIRDGEGPNYGVGSVRSKAAKQFRTLKQIQDSREQIVSKDQMEELKAEVNDEFEALAEESIKLRNAKRDGFYYDNIADDIKALAEGGLENMKYLREQYPNGAPFEKWKDYLEKLRNLPTEYFEAKIQRGVGLDEFAGAVVPKETSQDVIESLEKRGLQVIKYDERNEGSRAQAIRDIGAKRSDISFMPYSPELPKTEDGKIDWSVFIQEAQKPLSTLRAYAIPQQDEVN